MLNARTTPSTPPTTMSKPRRIRRPKPTGGSGDTLYDDDTHWTNALAVNTRLILSNITLLACIDSDFDARKTEILRKLRLVIDKSPKGSVDAPIVDLVDYVNSLQDYVRMVVLVGDGTNGPLIQGWQHPHTHTHR